MNRLELDVDEGGFNQGRQILVLAVKNFFPMRPCIPLLLRAVEEQTLHCLVACRRSSFDFRGIRLGVSRCPAPWTIERCESRVSAAERGGSLPSIRGGRDSLLLHSSKPLERPQAGR